MGDTILRGYRAQDAYPAVGSDGSAVAGRFNNRGELVVPDFYQQLVQDGRVFIASNVARETAAAMGTASATFSDTDPALLMFVPSGTTVMPLEIYLAQGGTVAGGVVTVLITLDDGTTRYSSGGVAVTPQNMRYDEPNTSLVTFYEGTTEIVAGANVDDVTLWAGLLDQDVSDPNRTENVDWSARKYIAPLLVGPANLLVYTYAATTQPAWFWHVTWAEIPTVSVT